MSLIDSAHKTIAGESVDKEYGLNVLSRAVLDEFTPNAYEGTDSYRAIVLCNAVPIPPDRHILQSGLNMAQAVDAAGDPNYAHFACRCRIVERGSPHASIPMPKNLIDSTPEDATLISHHPFFVTKDAVTETDSPQVGDVVYVTYEKGPEGGRMFKGMILTKPYLTQDLGTT